MSPTCLHTHCGWTGNSDINISYRRTTVHRGLHRGQGVMVFGHLAYVAVELCTGFVIPSTSLQKKTHKLNRFLIVFIIIINYIYYIFMYYCPPLLSNSLCSTSLRSLRWSPRDCLVLREPSGWRWSCVHLTTWKSLGPLGHLVQSTYHWSL